MTLNQDPLMFIVIRVIVPTSLYLEYFADCRVVEKGILLPHLPSKGNSPVIFWSGASLVSTVLEVIEFSFQEAWREAPSRPWRTNLSCNNFAESSLSS